jgi:hypothetical protein
MQKWGKVKEEQTDSEDEQTQEEKEAAQLEHWKARQLQAGAAQVNPNFIPGECVSMLGRQQARYCQHARASACQSVSMLGRHQARLSA